MDAGMPEEKPSRCDEKDVWDRIADVLEPIAAAVDPPPSESIEDERDK
jgi:hypothetical protein